MTVKFTMALVSAFLALPVAAMAGAEDRYRLERTEDGYVRMDTRTGEMSLCRERSGELVCRAGTDERKVHLDEMERMDARLKLLEDRLAALEAKPGNPSVTLPSEEDFEQTLGLMERFFRRFVDVFRDLDGDMRQKEPSQPVPERT